MIKNRRYKVIVILVFIASVLVSLLLLVRSVSHIYLRTTSKTGAYCTPYPKPVCTPDPDGPRIVFSSNRACDQWLWRNVNVSSYDLYVMNTDGTCATRLTYNRSSDSHHPRWSPDGANILFYTREKFSDDLANYLYLMNTDGSHMRRIANCGDCPANALWSPDGSQIAFLKGDDYDHCTLCAMSIDEAQETKLTYVHRNYRDMLPGVSLAFGWSPDGKQIAFSNAESEATQGDVYVINTDGNGLTNLTNHLAEDKFVAWAPDGHKMLFVSDRAITNTQSYVWTLYIMNADGTGIKRLVDYVRYWPEWGTWVPSSNSQIVVKLESDSKYYVVDIECVLTESTEPGILPEECRYELPQPPGVMVFSTWPSGGKQFSYQVVVTLNTGAKDIFVVDFDGTGLKNLTNCPADDKDPDWSP